MIRQEELDRADVLGADPGARRQSIPEPKGRAHVGILHVGHGLQVAARSVPEGQGLGSQEQDREPGRGAEAEPPEAKVGVAEGLTTAITSTVGSAVAKFGVGVRTGI